MEFAYVYNPLVLVWLAVWLSVAFVVTYCCLQISANYNVIRSRANGELALAEVPEMNERLYHQALAMGFDASLSAQYARGIISYVQLLTYQLELIGEPLDYGDPDSRTTQAADFIDHIALAPSAGSFVARYDEECSMEDVPF